MVDLERFKTAGFPEPGLYDPEIQKSYYFADTGLIAQNMYLTASLGLAAWFHNCNKAALEKKLGLKPHQRVLFDRPSATQKIELAWQPPLKAGNQTIAREVATIPYLGGSADDDSESQGGCLCEPGRPVAGGI
jgi:hypothetical protein